VDYYTWREADGAIENAEAIIGIIGDNKPLAA